MCLPLHLCLPCWADTGKPGLRVGPYARNTRSLLRLAQARHGLEANWFSLRAADAGEEVDDAGEATLHLVAADHQAANGDVERQQPDSE